MKAQPCIAIVGWKNTGKTTLVANLVKYLTDTGLAVSTLKHAHHSYDLDQAGTDSFAHRQAGAREVVLASGKRWAIQHELTDASEPTVWDMLKKMAPCDLVIVEGYKREALPKIEVLADQPHEEQLWQTDGDVVAIASDREINGCPLPRFARDDITAIAEFILEQIKSDDAQTS